MTNEMKNVPELRFSEFDGEWEQNYIGSYIKELKMFDTQQGSGFSIATSSRKGLFKQEDYFDGERTFSKNDVLYSIVPPNFITYRHMSDDNIFKFNINSFNENLLVSKEYPVFDVNNQADKKFVFYELNNNINFLKFCIKQKKGGTRTRLYFNVLEKYKTFFPILLEQQKIGNFFSKLDRQIELEEQKLVKLEEQKKGYMQKLFSQEIRFKDNKGNSYPDWKIVSIGDILKERTERSGEGDMLSVTINNGIIKFDEIDRKDNSSKDKSNYRKVYKDDIAYNSMRMWQGASGKSEYEGIVSPAYTVTIPNENINPDFIAYYFKTHKLIHKFKINSQGLTSDTWNLKYRQLKDIKINLCSKEEQSKIANLLIMYDKLINKQKHKLEILKTNKKGFLQKMFV